MIKQFISDILFRKPAHISYSSLHQEGDGKNCIYCQHPFTNWCLNPGYINSFGMLDHTREGFRKVSGAAKFSKKKITTGKTIYCLGGSTTYCTELDSYEKSWPHKLWKKLNRDKKNNIDVTNAGVGGWGTLQSLIRFTTWGQIIKPDLTIIYQAKNDFTFFLMEIAMKK